MVWNVINANVSYLRTLILKTEAGRRNHGRLLLAEPKLRNLNATLRRRRIFLLGWQIYRKFARQYVNCIVTSRSRDVTSLFRHLPYDVLFKKTRHCFNI